MQEIVQKNDFTADTQMTPQIMNQIGSNINIIANEVKKIEESCILIQEIAIKIQDWQDNEYTYEIQGITENDLATVWFKDPEQAAECEITAETVDGGIKFKCETVPDTTLSCSLEVKKVES